MPKYFLHPGGFAIDSNTCATPASAYVIQYSTSLQQYRFMMGLIFISEISCATPNIVNGSPLTAGWIVSNCHE